MSKLNRKKIAFLARLHFYGNPSRKLKIIGVTGTNGKTTIATLLYRLATELGYKVGLIGTIENRVGDKVIPATHTTPGPIPLNNLLKEMKDCDYVFMEVSSHALAQGRINGIKFIGGIFTNLSHEHLDYHKSIKKYFKTKKRFFKKLGRKAFALVNVDDEYSKKIVKGIKAKKYIYGFNNEIETKLKGAFNVYNVSAVFETAKLLDFDEDKVKEIIKNFDVVPGRFEIYQKNGIMGIVDYAHSPDALRNILESIKGRKIVVFGCGGDRDKTKRPEMMKIACRNSDIVIATADNPRSEKIEDIFEDMRKGIISGEKVYFEADREKAIKKACSLAKKEDNVLLAGKGHEKYQIIGTEKILFDDMEMLKKYL
ncbi:MAG: UDP-N-acetylmuramoyl-L-alanyl-D-glutamate--2,6-diaminopimelate ligase [Patescibacteria group bacterium]|nr:UDP-N-acetylmuramoyl-L-alanyl-D-glutamate--2,6-diaminopimelate ligase [Patescibacteria group bacterium]